MILEYNGYVENHTSYAREISKVEQLLEGFKAAGRWSVEELIGEFPQITLLGISDDDQIMLSDFVTQRVLSTWHQLKNLNNVYEECCREWFLPTYLAHISSGDVPDGVEIEPR